MVVNRISYALHRWILYMKKNCFPLAETVLEQDFMRITIITYYLWSAKLQVLFLLKSIQNSNRAVSASTSTKTFSKKLEDYGAYVFFSYGGSYDNSDYCSCIMIFRTKGIGTITAFPLYKGALVSFSLDQSTNTVSLQCNVTTLIMGMYKIY